MQEVTRMLKIVYENYAEYHDDKNLVEALSSIQSSYENLSYEETVIMAAEQSISQGVFPSKNSMILFLWTLNMISRCLNWYIMILSSLLLIEIGLHLKSMGKHKIEWSLKFFIMFYRFTIWMMNSGMNIK